jgi:DNA-binding response OmpR family regulator
MEKRARILVAEDDRKTAASLRLYLEHANYQVLLAYDGAAALAIARGSLPDLAILDWMLPRLSGLELCAALRAESSIFIIMLTARTTEDDKLRGLSCGADDYVTKPFSPREVVARVKAVLRRNSGRNGDERALLEIGELKLNCSGHEVRFQDALLPLTPTEFCLLEILMRSPGRTFTRDHLMDKAFGTDRAPLDRTVDAHVKNLRNKLHRVGADSSLIQTVHGVGYKFIEPDHDA